ncbi:MAG: hypothetical protein C0432_05265 [Candidatus Puniceispirillum sp.]|nr:hypothetical protein [Candidatus Pelagibacter sp.]MBA4283684.1 hypothetical protein [Candidatus Puniceispirillum sp.]
MFSQYADQKFYMYLKKLQILSNLQWDIVEMEMKSSNDSIEEIILYHKFLTRRDILRYKASMFHTEYLDIKNVTVSFEFTKNQSAWMKMNKIFPLYIENNVLYVAMDDPENIKVIDGLCNIMKEHKLDKSFFHIYYCPSNEILFKWVKTEKVHYSEITDTSKLLDAIFERAFICQSSDIHFHPQKNYVEVSFRISGILKKECILEKNMWNMILTRLKVLSNLDVTESRKPQSGHYECTILEKKVDLRMSTHPSIYGENLTIRLLQHYNQLRSLKDLGFDEDIFLELESIIQKPQGLLVVTGPTGSGKTSTLYALVQEIQKYNKNIMTLESPVECYLPGIRQTEIREGAILDYADGIRSILRQDPDVILIGEIRDEETAKMAVRAALTGHFVIATMHTVDTLGVPLRLKELDISNQLMTETLIGVLSQRLVRVICKDCKGLFDVNTQCLRCEDGYSHREALGEFLKVDIEWSHLLTYASRKELEEKRLDQEKLSLKERMSKWIQEGKTTQKESNRIFGLE